MEVIVSLKALVVVDVQRDFCPGGALPIARGDMVIPKLNVVIKAFEKASLPIFFTRDWHPVNHISFRAMGGTWPPHCVMDTRGAEFHPMLRVPSEAAIISKGSAAHSEAYSCFHGTDLEQRLKKLGVKEILLGGLATDYCVKETALDALAAGFTVEILEDCMKGVNVQEGDSEQALRVMIASGAKLTNSFQALLELEVRRAPLGNSKNDNQR